MKPLFNLFFCISILFFSCNSINKKNNSFPTIGSFYFTRERPNGNEYLEINFKNEVVNGNFYLNEPESGNVYYTFSGKPINDTTIAMNVIKPHETVEEQHWTVVLEKNKINLMNHLHFVTKTIMRKINKQDMPNKNDYNKAELVEAEEENELFE